MNPRLRIIAFSGYAKGLGTVQGRVKQFLHCGTVWIHGPGVELPVTEEQPRRPISEYGRQKAAIEEYLLREHRQNGFPAAL